MAVHPNSLANLAPRFVPGTTLNPGGKPVNARNRLTKAFLEALADDFQENGDATIIAARLHDPCRYLAIVASLMPKELVIERPTDGMTDEQLGAALEFIRSRLVEIDRGQARGGSDVAPVSQPAEVLPPIQQTE